MLPHPSPTRFNCIAFGSAAGAAIERLPAHDPRQQRGEGHSRSCPMRTSLRGRQSGCLGTLCGDNQLVCTAHHPTSRPQGNAPACRPPCGKPGVRAECVLASCGSFGCHSVLALWRPHAVCADRAAVIVALSPVHAPAVPFIAASIPPQLPNPSSQAHARKTPCHVHQSI